MKLTINLEIETDYLMDAEVDNNICSDAAIVIHNCINSGKYTTKEQVVNAMYTQWDNDDHL